jgi:hypothetical protein
MPEVGQTSRHPVILTLVHGTWGPGFFPRKPGGRRTFWFESKSRFVRELSARLSRANIAFVIHEFLWSGSNSFLARSNAARKLAEHLNQRHRDNPKFAQFIIGHSHGGTVAMLASKYLDEDNNPNLITLATPFVELGTETPSNRLILATFNLILLIAGFLMIATTYPIVTVGAPLFGYSFDDVPALAFQTLLVATFLGFVALVGYLVLGVQISRDPLTRIGKLWSEAWAGLSNVRQLNILVIRGVDDEATLTLAVGAIGNRIIGKLYQIIAIFSALLVPLCLWYGPNSLVPHIPHLDEFQNWYFATLLPIPAVALLCLTLSGLFRSVYGRELSFGTFFMQMKSHSTPDSDRLTALTFPPRELRLGGLRHGIYDHEEVCETIAAWIERQIECAPSGRKELQEA